LALVDGFIGSFSSAALPLPVVQLHTRFVYRFIYRFIYRSIYRFIIVYRFIYRSIYRSIIVYRFISERYNF
jgi:hypothetical protein